MPGRRGSTLDAVPIVQRLPYEPWRQRGAVVDGHFRWRLGTRPLDLEHWVEMGPDAHGPDGWIAHKQRILEDHHSTAFAALDGIEPEATEVADALLAHVRGRWPERFGDIELDAGVHPLEAASRLVPEDLALMVERDGRLVFGGGAVCFPNRWDLPSKIGQPLADVHRPVARLNDQLQHGIDRFLEQLASDRPVWRLGWGVIDVADGYTPLDGTGPERPTDPGIDDLFVRVERETLRRFDRTRCVLFTIRTYIAPIGAVLADAASSTDMAALISALPSDVREYKDLVGHGEGLVDRLIEAGGVVDKS